MFRGSGFSIASNAGASSKNGTSFEVIDSDNAGPSSFMDDIICFDDDTAASSSFLEMNLECESMPISKVKPKARKNNVSATLALSRRTGQIRPRKVQGTLKDSKHELFGLNLARAGK